MIIEYHKFTSKPDPYQWSRTFKQFEEDLVKIKKLYNDIRMDDGHISQVKACQMANKLGLGVFLGITTGYIGKEGYMEWKHIRKLVGKNFICNHSMYHEHMDEWTEDDIYDELKKANEIINTNTGIRPEFYCPTYNFLNDNVRYACYRLDLKILDPVKAVNNTMTL